VVGLSFLVERYQLVSRALQGAFQLMDWVPGVTGQQAWGICFVIGGVFVLSSWHIYVRAVALVGGATSWAIFAGGPLYEAWFGPQADDTGAYSGLMAAFVCLCFFLAIIRLGSDFASSSAKVSA